MLVPGTVVTSVLPSLNSKTKLLVLLTSIVLPKSAGTSTPYESDTTKVTVLKPPLSSIIAASAIVIV